MSRSHVSILGVLIVNPVLKVTGIEKPVIGNRLTTKVPLIRWIEEQTQGTQFIVPAMPFKPSKWLIWPGFDQEGGSMRI